MTEQIETPLETLERISGKARGHAILAVVRQLAGDGARITPAAVDAMCFTLPHWSECGDDEVIAALACVEADADAHVARLVAEAAGSTDAEPQPEALSADNTYSAEVGDRDAALARVNQLTRNLGDARSALTAAGNRLRTLRTAAAAAIEAWVAGLPRQSFRDALKAVSETQRLTKQQRMERTVPGPSRIDRERFYGRGGDAGDFVRGQFKNGGSRRGALPLSRLRGKLDLGGTAPMPSKR